MCGRYVCPSSIPQIAVCVSALGKWPGKKIPRGLFGLSLYAYLSAMLIHKSLNINTDRTRTLIQNCKLWLVVKQSGHLKTQKPPLYGQLPVGLMALTPDLAAVPPLQRSCTLQSF